MPDEDLFLVGEDGELVPMATQPFDTESRLQELLEHYPKPVARGAAHAPIAAPVVTRRPRDRHTRP